MRRTQPIVLHDAENCPFCGEKPVLEPHHKTGPAKWMVLCWGNQGENGVDCHAMPQVSGPTRKVAIARWNTRSEA